MAEPIHHEPGTNGHGSFQSGVLHEPRPEDVANPITPGEIEVSHEGEPPDELIISNRLPGEFKLVNREWIFQRTIGGAATVTKKGIEESRRRGKRNIAWLGDPGDIPLEGEEPQNYREVEAAELMLLHDASKSEPFTLHRIPKLPPEVKKNHYEVIANGFGWPNAHEMTNRYMKQKVTTPTTLVNPQTGETREHTFSQKYEPLPQEQIEAAWEDYRLVNRAFAKEALKLVSPHTDVKINDYQLFTVAQEMRKGVEGEKGFEGKISFYLHIPVSRPDVFRQMPHAQEIAKALLSCDVVAVQTEEDRDNFVAFLAEEGIEAELREDAEKGTSYFVVKTPDRNVRIQAIPVSVEPKEYQDLAQRPSVIEKANEIRETYGDKEILFNAGRLDYAKGIVESLMAYYMLLDESRKFAENQQAMISGITPTHEMKLNLNEDLRDKMVYILALPLSRTGIPAYRKTKHQVEQMFEMIYEKFGHKYYREETDPESSSGKRLILKKYKELNLEEKQKQPIVHIDALDEEGIGAYNEAADVLIVPSRKDGQNLVGKEGVAVAKGKAELAKTYKDMALLGEESPLLPIFAREHKTPVLLMSKGSGASHELTGSLQFDTRIHSDNTLDTLKQLNANILELAGQMYAGATMPEEEREQRMEENFAKIEAHTVDDWAQDLQDALDEAA